MLSFTFIQNSWIEHIKKGFQALWFVALNAKAERPLEADAGDRYLSGSHQWETCCVWSRFCVTSLLYVRDLYSHCIPHSCQSALHVRCHLVLLLESIFGLNVWEGSWDTASFMNHRSWCGSWGIYKTCHLSFYTITLLLKFVSASGWNILIVVCLSVITEMCGSEPDSSSFV